MKVCLHLKIILLFRTSIDLIFPFIVVSVVTFVVFNFKPVESPIWIIRSFICNTKTFCEAKHEM